MLKSRSACILSTTRWSSTRVVRQYDTSEIVSNSMHVAATIDTAQGGGRSGEGVSDSATKCTHERSFAVAATLRCNSFTGAQVRTSGTAQRADFYVRLALGKGIKRCKPGHPARSTSGAAAHERGGRVTRAVKEPTKRSAYVEPQQQGREQCQATGLSPTGAVRSTKPQVRRAPFHRRAARREQDKKSVCARVARSYCTYLPPQHHPLNPESATCSLARRVHQPPVPLR